MAIVKFLCEESDFNSLEGVVDTNSSYWDSTRTETGWYFTYTDSFVATWPVLANDVWFHFRMGQSTSNTLWDDTRAFRFNDIDGNQMMALGIENGTHVWRLFGDTTTSATYTAVVGTGQIFDVQLVKNGTTDFTLNVWRDGVLVVNALTTGNTVDYDIPVSWTLNLLDTSPQTYRVYFNECVIADEDTRGWRLRQHLPTAFGVDTDWIGDANGVVGGNMGNGIISDTLDDLAGFGVSNIENLPVAVVVDRVVLQTYAQRGATGLAKFNHFFRYDTPTYDHDADHTLALSTEMFIDEYPTSPDTGVAWTDTEMAGIQFGVRSRT